MKFEYKVISETVPHGMQEELLNIMGAEGWELVHYDPDTRIVHSKATMYAVFKRSVPPQRPYHPNGGRSVR